MKYLSMLFCFIMFSAVVLPQDKETKFDVKSAIYLGIDFSIAKYVDEPGKGDINEIIEKQIPAINALMLSEPKKFNFEKYLSISVGEKSLDMITKKNAEIDKKTFASSTPTPLLKNEEIKKEISQYDCGKYKGTGLVVVIQELNKIETKAKMHFVFFDIESKKILFNKYFITDPSGFGFRNYWANSIHRALKEFQDAGEVKPLE